MPVNVAVFGGLGVAIAPPSNLLPQPEDSDIF